jgi:hypothetical protein
MGFSVGHSLLIVHILKSSSGLSDALEGSLQMTNATYSAGFSGFIFRG